MATYGSIRVLPQADLVVREGDTYPIPWTFSDADGTPLDLSAVDLITLHLRPIRGDQTPVVYYSTTPTPTPTIQVTTPTLGGIAINPPAEMFSATGESYRGYFTIAIGAVQGSVPHERDIWIDVLPRVGT